MLARLYYIIIYLAIECPRFRSIPTPANEGLFPSFFFIDNGKDEGFHCEFMRTGSTSPC